MAADRRHRYDEQLDLPSTHGDGSYDAVERANGEAATEQISPELALVDPELARIARSKMPDRPGRSETLAPDFVRPEEPPRRTRTGPPLGTVAPTRTLRTAIASEQAHLLVSTGMSHDKQLLSARATTRTPSIVRAGAPRGTSVFVGAGAAPPLRGEQASDQIAPRLDRPPRARRLRRVLAVLAVPALFVAALFAGIRLSAADSFDDPRTFGAARALAEERGARRGGPSVDAAAPEQPRASRRKATAPAPRALSRPTRQRARVARNRSRAPATRPRPTASAASSESRVFVWLPDPRANRYRVEFFRGGRKIFQARTVKPRLRLPRRWAFNGRRFELTPGTYRWLVRPAYGRASNARYGAPIVASRWVVPR